MVITKCNAHDRVTVTKLMQNIKNKLFVDNGYIYHKLSEFLSESGIKLIMFK